jgi:DNA-directed RNA polymerase III subunit RPC8
MFVLVEIEDTIRVSPDKFANLERCIMEEIGRKFGHRVINGIGLCVCAHDLVSATDAVVAHGEGAANVHARFRLVVFRPLPGELVVGRIVRSTEHGVQVSLDFTSSVIIPAASLPSPSHFFKEEQQWCWMFQGNQLWMETGAEIRFKVEQVIFNAPTERPDPAAAAVAGAKQQQRNALQKKIAAELPEQPMLIVG